MIKVLKQMVEALEHELCIDWTNNEEFNASAEKMHDAIQAGKKAIAELESQEPFCYVYKENGEDFFAPKDGYYPADAKPLYTHPPQRTWVGLTIDEREQIQQECFGKVPHHVAFAHAVEAKLKEKNT
jgi:hypothetical protein